MKATDITPKDATFLAWCGNGGRPRMNENGLVWLAGKGMGFYPVNPATEPYDDGYFAKYVGYGKTLLGRALTQARLAVTNRFAPEATLVDVGIGCGDFVKARRAYGSPTFGFDIMERAKAWLRSHEAWLDPHAVRIPAASFWDTLEHIEEPARILGNVDGWAFISMPIYRDAAHCATSKHFRPTEHRWYFTARGLVAWMNAQGFAMRHFSRVETELGREDVGTFAFERFTHRERQEECTS